MATESHLLKRWMDRHDISQAQFAREIECSEPYLSEILNGKKEPSLEFASKLSKATGGKVPISAFLRPEAVR